jgi:hypothetical protein
METIKNQKTKNQKTKNQIHQLIDIPTIPVDSLNLPIQKQSYSAITSIIDNNID